MNKFCDAVTEIDSVTEDDCRPGLQALTPADREKIICKDTRSLTGSICLDETLKPLYPHAARWDYGVGIKTGRTNQAIWIEVHPAQSGDDVRSMVEKVKWLKERIRESSGLRAMTDGSYRWIASGKVTVPRSGSHRRLLEKHGITPPQKMLELP